MDHDRRTDLRARRWLLRASLAVAVLAVGLAPVGVNADEACVSGLVGHGKPYLTGFTGPFDAGSKFYAVAETAGSASVTIAVTPGHCVDQSGSTATYSTQNGTAVAGQDYAATSGTTGLLCRDVDQQVSFCGTKPPTQSVGVPISSDGILEDPVESFLFRLTAGSPFGLFTPNEAAVHVIDVSGSARASLEPTLTGDGAVAYQQDEFGTVGIPVFWAGQGPPKPVSYSVGPPASGPAATEGIDYTVESQNPLPVASSRVGFIRIRIIGDKLSEPDESVAITLQDGLEYELGELSSTTFTILDNENDRIAPVTRFHHPKEGRKYRRGDYRIREFHTFYREEGGAGIATAHVALRRKMDSGACQWWHGSRFRRGKCGAKVWKTMKYEPSLDWFYAGFPALRPTAGTNIRNYRAWTRAVDRTGNVERTFERGRNLSTFWIRNT